MTERRIGRPPSDKSMRRKVEVRMDDETISKLDECVEKLDSNRSEVIRKGIVEMHKKTKR